MDELQNYTVYSPFGFISAACGCTFNRIFFFLNKQSFLNYWNPWISLKDFFQAADFYFLRVISIWFLQMCGILAKETLCKLFHWNLHHSACSCGHLIFLVQFSSPQLLRLVHPGQLHWYLFNLSALVSAIL